jgi:DNA-binding NarL/FixJ family response regulator
LPGRRRILVVGRRRLYLEALCEFLDRIPTLAATLVSALPPADAVPGPAPDVVLVDCPPGCDGVASEVASATAIYPGSPTWLLTSGTDRESAEQTATSGADAWVSMSLSLGHLVDALADDKPAVGAVGSPASPPKLEWPLSELSQREMSVVRLIAGGQPADQIALALGISGHTVRTHVQNAMAKMGVRSRTQMVSVAVRAGLRARPAGPPSDP